jgi:hypothetical protein
VQTATLGGVPGIVDLRFRLHSGVDGEWQGTFFFQSDDDLHIARIVGQGATTLETTLEAERRTLQVTVTSFTETGHAVFRTDQWSASTERAGVLSPSGSSSSQVKPGLETTSRRRRRSPARAH